MKPLSTELGRLRTRALAAAVGMAWLAAAGAAPSGPQGVQSSDISPQLIDLKVEVRPALAAVLVEAKLSFAANRRLEEARFFLRQQLELDSVEDAAGVPLAYRHRRGRVAVMTPPLEPGVTTSWTFRYRIRLEQSLDAARQVLRTEPWYPHLRYPYNPQEFPRYVPMRSRLSATIPKPWVLVSTGTRTVQDRGDLTAYTWRDQVPSPAIPLVIGPFEERIRRIGGLTFRGFFDPGSAAQLGPYVDYVADAVRFFSERFGELQRRDYSLVGVGLPESVSGMTVSGVTFLQRAAVAPGIDFPHRILAHEIAHHWWNYGLQIPRRRDGWLREGLPTYSSLMFLEHQFGTAMMRQELERSRRVALGVPYAEPLERGFEMASTEAIYAMNYHKAAFVLHMLRGVIGGEVFERLLATVQTLDTDLTTANFIGQAEELHGDDLSWFFSSWLQDAGIPTFSVRYRSRPRRDAAVPVFEITGTIQQHGAGIRHPVLLRVPLEGAPPFEQLAWIEPGTAEFTMLVPSAALGLEFDPHGDLLHGGVTVEAIEASR